MPLKIRWSSKEYISFAFIFFGLCGLFQVLFIFIGQYFLTVGNYLIVIIIPIGITFATFFACLIIFEAFAEVERAEKLKRQYRKSKTYASKFKNFLYFPIVRPLLITFAFFTAFFFLMYFIFLNFLTDQISFMAAEIFAGVVCLLIANYFEKNYAKIRRF